MPAREPAAASSAPDQARDATQGYDAAPRAAIRAPEPRPSPASAARAVPERLVRPSAPVAPVEPVAPPPPVRDTAPRELSARAELARAELARELLPRGGPVPGDGTRRWVARGEALRRQLLAEAAREPKPLPRSPRVQRAATDGISIDELDREVDRAVGRMLRRFLWIVSVLAIGGAAWLGLQIVVGR